MEGEQDEYVPFSIREGIQPRKAIQWQSMDDPLRTAIWNMLTIEFWQHFANPMIQQPFTAYDRINLVGVRIWANILDRTIDSIPNDSSEFITRIRRYYLQLPWYKVYDLIEFTSKQTDIRRDMGEFIEHTNMILRRHSSPYQFVGGVLATVTSETEIHELEEALNSTAIAPLRSANRHLSTALQHMSARPTADYRNAIKEAISAVEAICKVLAGTPNSDLGAALSALMTRKQLPLHPQFRQALASLYSFTNDAEGIRHALKDDPTLDVEDARFMLVTCSAFVNYLLVKADKAGISLTGQSG
jgi:hypothetical protein